MDGTLGDKSMMNSGSFDSGLSSGFGVAHSFCDFSGQGGPGPAQMWDPGRPTAQYSGGLHMTAGSNPEDGFGPFSNFEGSTNNDAFFSRDSGSMPHTPVLGGDR